MTAISVDLMPPATSAAAKTCAFWRPRVGDRPGGVIYCPRSFRRDTGRVGAPHGSQHDHPHQPAPARRRSSGARPRPVRLPEPRSRRVRHAGGSLDRDHVRAHAGGASRRGGRRARARGARRAQGGRRARAGGADGRRHREQRNARGGRVRVRAGRPARGRAAAPAGRLRRRARSHSVLRAAGRRRRGGALVRAARQPPQRALLRRRRRHADGDRPRRGRRAQPARPGRLVAGALPARRREGEGRPPRARGRDRVRALQGGAGSTGCSSAPPTSSCGELEQKLHPYLRERIAGPPAPRRRELRASRTSGARPRGRSRTGGAACEREALDRLVEGVGRGGKGAAGHRRRARRRSTRRASRCC